MANAYIGAGIAKAAQQLPAQIEQLNQAKAMREKADLELSEFKGNADLRESQADLEMAQVKQATYNTNSQLLQQQTYDAFTRYKGDGEARHLNNFLTSARKNPQGVSTYGDIARVDNMVKSAENDKMLQQAGITDLEGFYQDPDLASQYVIATMADGTKGLTDMQQLYAMTGYTRHLSQQELADSERNAAMLAKMRQGQTKDTVTDVQRITASIQEGNPDLSYADAYQQAVDIQKGTQSTNKSDQKAIVESILEANPNMPYHEAVAQAVDIQKGSMSGSADTRMINQIAEEDGLSISEATQKYYDSKRGGSGGANTDQARFIQDFMSQNEGSTWSDGATAYANRTKTGTQKEVGDIREVKASLDERGFFDMDIPNMSTAERAEVHKSIAEIEDLRGIKLSSEEKRMARDLRNLYTLGGQAGTELSDAETGFLDNTLGNMKEYFSDNVSGVEAKSSYETFRNVFRNALYGAALSKHEIEAFTKAAGSLKQQLGPVLSKLKVQMGTVKAQLESIRDMDDPYLAHFYFGKDLEDVDEAIRQIDERIKLLDRQDVPEVTAPQQMIMPEVRTNPVQDVLQTTTPVVDGADRPPLSELLPGLGG